MDRIMDHWIIEFSDRNTTFAWTYDQMVKIVRKEMDPKRFRNGNVTQVTHVVTKWQGSYRNGTRTYETLRAEILPLNELR